MSEDLFYGRREPKMGSLVGFRGVEPQRDFVRVFTLMWMLANLGVRYPVDDGNAIYLSFIIHAQIILLIHLIMFMQCMMCGCSVHRHESGRCG